MTTATKSNTDICTEALRLAGVTAVDEAATAYDMSVAIETLDDMLKHFQNDGFNLWAVASQAVTLVADDRDYTMSPERPLQILNVNYRDADGRDLPMIRLTREEYDTLPVKTTSGIPTNFYYDKQREDALLYIWPVLSSVTTETLQVTYIRELADVSGNNAVDVPSEWYATVKYNLASWLIDIYNTNRPRIVQRAEMLYDTALGFDREGSVYFAGPMAD